MKRTKAGRPWRKLFSSVSIASLLIAQQAPLFHEPLAQTVSQAAGASGASAAGQAGAVATGLSGSAQNIALPPAASLLSPGLGGAQANLGLPTPVTLAGAAAASAQTGAQLTEATPAAPRAGAADAARHTASRPSVAAPKAVEASADPALAQAAQTARASRAAVPAIGAIHAVETVAAPVASRSNADQPGVAAAVYHVEAKLSKLHQPGDGAALGDAEARLSSPVQEPLPPPPGTPTSLAETTLDVEPGREYFPSPEDWRDQLFYFLMIDRFSKSKSGIGYGDPKSGNSRHGGDIKGVIAKLDYLKAAKVTTLVLSPVAMNLPDSYHGYAPVHFLSIDPHMGTMEDFKLLVQEAHKRGIRVVLDWLTNHTGPVFEYKDGAEWQPMDKPPKEIEHWTRELLPRELNNQDNFTRHGVISNWNDHDQAINGDFPPNYRHFATNQKQTQDLLIYIAKWWIKETDIDGIRVDAIRHINPAFLPRFIKEVREFAASIGKKSFFILGENSTGIDGELVPFMGESGVDSLYSYPAFRRESYAIHGAAPTRDLENSLAASLGALGQAASRLMSFIDLHDTYRYLRKSTPGAMLKVAVGLLLFSMGIPLVYAGTEQALRQTGIWNDRLDPENGEHPADPYNREDLFPEGHFKSETSQGDVLNPSSPPLKMLAKLANVRAAYAPLRRGQQYPRWSDPNGAGIYAFSRIHNGEEVLVVLNTAGEARSATMWVDGSLTPAGTRLTDALDTGYALQTHAPEGGGSKATVDIPAHGVRVLVRKLTAGHSPAP